MAVQLQLLHPDADYGQLEEACEMLQVHLEGCSWQYTCRQAHAWLERPMLRSADIGGSSPWISPAKHAGLGIAFSGMQQSLHAALRVTSMWAHAVSLILQLQLQNILCWCLQDTFEEEMASDIADMVMGRHLRTHGDSPTTGLTFNSNVLTGRLQVLCWLPASLAAQGKSDQGITVKMPASELRAAPAWQHSTGALCSGHSLLCSRPCSFVSAVPG